MGNNQGRGQYVLADAESIQALIRAAVRETLTELVPMVLDGAVQAAAHDGKGPGAPKELLSTQEAAAVAGVCTKTMRSWISEGRLPCRRAGRLLRVERRDLMRFLSVTGSDSPGADDPKAVARAMLALDGL